MGSEKRWATVLPLRVGQVEFRSTVEADLVRAVFDGEHTAEVTVAASKNKLEDA
jgi:hypothetical protein